MDKDYKPIMETESFRILQASKKTMKKLQGVNELKIIYKGQELGLMGFGVAKTKDNNPFFAWKFNEEKRTILYYIFKENVTTEPITMLLNIINNTKDYQVINCVDMFDNIINEMPSIDARLKEDKDGKTN